MLAEATVLPLVLVAIVPALPCTPAQDLVFIASWPNLEATLTRTDSKIRTFDARHPKVSKANDSLVEFKDFMNTLERLDTSIYSVTAQFTLEDVLAVVTQKATEMRARWLSGERSEIGWHMYGDETW
jgi:hypothetical protein